MGFPLYVTCCFSVAAFGILSLCLVFVSLISMCLGVFLHGFTMYGTLCASWTWLTIFFPILGKFSSVIFKHFLICFLFLFLFYDTYNSNVGAFDIVPVVSETILFFFFPFFLLYYALQKLFPTCYLSAHWLVLLLQIFCYWFLLEYF